MARDPRHARARRLRREATEAERKLWRALREAAPAARFRRQHPVGPYIADFVCTSRCLVVEVDGGQHAVNAAADAERTAALARHGYRVIRFWNNEVLENVEGVVTTILRELG